MTFLTNILSSIRITWQNGSARSKLALKNIIISLFLKFTSILTSLLVVPLTIDYLDGIEYGIWLSISSIVAWANFFDLGLANGFKNKFAESLANSEYTLAREYLSTTYIFISIIMFVIMICVIIINNFIDLATILNVSQSYAATLHTVFLILSVIFCMNMIANVFVKMVEADQRPSIAAVISCIGQIISLIVIYILTKTTKGSLINLALYFSGIPFMTMLVSSIILFSFSRYRRFRPSFKCFRPLLIKNLLGLGFKFFFIYLCLIAIFQLMNIVLSRECSSIAVSEYNVSYKYFSMVYMVFVIVISPMWAAFTDAYIKNDFVWMTSIYNKFERYMKWLVGLCFLMLAVSPVFYKLWLHGRLEIGWTLSIGTCIYVISQLFGTLYMNLINGIGTIRIQLIIYSVFAVISYPLMSLICRHFGPVGIIVIPSIVYLCQAIVLRKQLNMILSNQANGIWLK